MQNRVGNGADVQARPRQSFRFGRGRISRSLSNQGQQSHMHLNTQDMYQQGQKISLVYAQSRLTRMDARLAFFALEDLARAVLVTCKTAVLWSAITRCRWRSGWNRPV